MMDGNVMDISRSAIELLHSRFLVSLGYQQAQVEPDSFGARILRRVTAALVPGASTLPALCAGGYLSVIPHLEGSGMMVSLLSHVQVGDTDPEYIGVAAIAIGPLEFCDEDWRHLCAHVDEHDLVFATTPSPQDFAKEEQQ